MFNREELKSNILDIERNMLQEVPVKLRAACQDDLKPSALCEELNISDN